MRRKTTSFQVLAQVSHKRKFYDMKKKAHEGESIKKKTIRFPIDLYDVDANGHDF